MTVYITGVSSGIGKALAETFLSLGAKVIGIGRKSEIVSDRYRFITCDLQSVDAIAKLDFHQKDDCVILINNAGVIGPIDHFSELDPSGIQTVVQVNTVAPLLITNKFLKAQNHQQKAIVVNISSGAASKSIASWATYCASKAALDRFSEVLQVEMEEANRPVKVYSISPGVVDTPMQLEIRSSQKDKFSALAYFQELKVNDGLAQPDDIARKIVRVILELQLEKVILSLREID